MPIQITYKGSFENLEKVLSVFDSGRLYSILQRAGQEGVAALSSVTPVDSGNTAKSWGYNVILEADRFGVEWSNSNTQGGYSIALLLQYGHGTKNGGYIQGIDYINPVIRPIFEALNKTVGEEVRKL